MKTIEKWQVINQRFDGSEEVLETCASHKDAEHSKHRLDKVYSDIILRKVV